MSKSTATHERTDTATSQSIVNKSFPLPIKPEQIPAALREQPKWLCWREEGDKKPPYNPTTNRKSDSNSPETWTDFETALNAYRNGNYDGVGFVLTKEDPFVCFDFDDCRSLRTGEINEGILQELERVDSYSEISPSGEGLHILVRGEKPDDYGCHGNGVEVYDSDRYITVTGAHLAETPQTIESRPDELTRVCQARLNKQLMSADSVEPKKSSSRTAPSDELVELGESALQQLQRESAPVFKDVMSFLQGGIGDFDQNRLTKDGGMIDRSAQEQVGISLTYLTMNRYLDEPEDQIQLITRTTWMEYCQTHRRTSEDQSQVRKWIDDSESDLQDYRERIFTYATRTADPDRFEMMIEKKGDDWRRRKHGEYSELTYYAVAEALDQLTPSIDEVREEIALYRVARKLDQTHPKVLDLYPEKSDIAQRAREIDSGYNGIATYEKALQRLQTEHGLVKSARIGSHDWVVYPKHHPDLPPDEYSYYHLQGQKHHPEPGSP